MEFETEIEQLINRAIEEDFGSGDITTEACIPESAITSGRILTKQAGVIAGLPFLVMLYKKIDPSIEVMLYIEEGSYHKSGTNIAKISGPARGILTGERLALNLLQHTSGIATMTRAFAKKLRGLKCDILDTRKTLPGLRALEKYAVKVGGGVNHRFHLDDRFIIKANHLAFVSGESSDPIHEAVRKVKSVNDKLPIEIEITSIDQLEAALKTDTDAIMLSRMIPSMIARCVKRIRQTKKKVYIESLGLITLDTIRAYAETGVDGISIGSITYSVPGIEMGIRLASFQLLNEGE